MKNSLEDKIKEIINGNYGLVPNSHWKEGSGKKVIKDILQTCLETQEEEIKKIKGVYSFPEDTIEFIKLLRK